VRHQRAARHSSEYLDGTLRGRPARRFEAHLAGCSDCQRELAELRRTTELLRSLRGGEEAPDLSGTILARIRAGEAEPSALDRLRFAASRFFSGAWGAPLATAAVGLALLAIVPRIEIEVSVPGIARPEAAQPIASAPAPQRPPAPALATRRVREPLLPSGALPGRQPSASVDCWEQPSFEACQEQRRLFMELALRDTRAFLERVEAVPSTQRERWIGELSRFAAEAGSASSVAQRLRASDDPRARQMAPRFESQSQSFDGR
jgi:hypothetical protein